MKHLVLASTSPRRQDLFRKLEIPFEVQSSYLKEKIEERGSPRSTVMALAFQKAFDVSKKQEKGTIVVGADTIVYKDKILGKPKDEKEAYAMLKKLSGSVHQVYTGMAIVEAGTNRKVIDCSCAHVKFYPLSEKKLKWYVESGEPFGKAGAYAIQEKGMLFVEEICGDFYTVMGLSMSKLEETLEKHFCIHLLTSF